MTSANSSITAESGLKPFRRPLVVLSAMFSRPVYRRMAAVIAVAYLLVYLAAIQNLTFSLFAPGGGGGGFSVVTADLSAMVRRTGFLIFDAVAVIGTPVVTIHISPINIVVGAVLSALVGLNLSLTWIAWRQPKACSVNRASGVLGLLPGLLAGGACCAPTIIIILGIQATATMITATQWMIPIAFVLLVGSLVWITHKTRPELL